jgi:erythromycin esterase
MLARLACGIAALRLATTLLSILAPADVSQLSAAQKNAIVAELRKYAHPLSSAYPVKSQRDLAPVLHAVGSAQIIAMGEASHGTSELFSLKDRFFRYLVEHDGVRIFAMEANWSDGEQIDRYLQTGQGSLRDILASTWDSREVLRLIQWMRCYNISHHRALHFFGMDMQQPNTVISYLVDFYKTYEPTQAAGIKYDEACIDKPTMRLFKDSLSDGPKCIVATRFVVQELASDSNVRRSAGRAAYLAAFHAAELVEEAAIEYSYKDIKKKAAARDLAMAHNVQWLVSVLYPSSKVFLWAHNGHVGVGLEAWPSMGTILRQSYGSDYFTIGQTFDHGSVSQPEGETKIPPAIGNASEVIFRKVGMSPFFLDFREVPRHSQLGRWLFQPNGIRSLGAGTIGAAEVQNEIAATLPLSFDAITFIDTGHPVQWLHSQVVRRVSVPPEYSGWLKAMDWKLHSFAAEDANAGMRMLPDSNVALFVTARPEEHRLFAYLDGRLNAEPYRGKSVTISGMIATSNAEPGASLGFAAYGSDNASPLVYQTVPQPILSGTTAWTRLSVTLIVPQAAKTLSSALVLNGGGTAWLENPTIKVSP